MLTWVQCMQSLLKAMNRDLQGLWIARLARDPLLVSGLLLPVWCVGARTRFLMTRCTIPTFVNVFAGNLFIRLQYCDIFGFSFAANSHFCSFLFFFRLLPRRLLTQSAFIQAPSTAHRTREASLLVYNYIYIYIYTIIKVCVC